MLQHFAQLTSSMNSHSQATGGDQAMLLVANFPLHSDNSLFAPQANAIYLELERLGFRVSSLLIERRCLVFHLPLWLFVKGMV